EAVETVRIVDRLGRTQLADSLHPLFESDGSLSGEIAVSAVPIRWDSSPGLRLERDDAPDDVPGPPTCRFFVQRGRRLVAVTGWCWRTEGPERGNLIRFSSVQRYFVLSVPARVLLDRPEGGLRLAAPPPDPASGLTALALAYPPTRW